MASDEQTEPTQQALQHKRHHHHPKSSKRKFHVWRWLGGFVLLFFIVVGVYVAAMYHDLKTTTDHTYVPLSGQKSDTISKKQPTSILLMGTDTGALGRTEDRGRTDTLIMVTINPKTKTTTMVSIPRDTMAKMVGYQGVNIQKINAAYSIGGSDMAVKTVKSLLNVPVDHYALVNMGGLEKVVDAVGGVDVDVPFSFKSKQDNYKHQFTKGMMHLDGSAALAYVRMRYEDPRGDYGRAERQRQVIAAILKAAPSLNTLANFKTLLGQVESNFRSSMDLGDMTNLYTGYKGASANVNQDVVQGTSAYLKGSSYQIASTKELQRVSDELRTSLGLKKETLSNEETKQNALNSNFDWSSSNSTEYKVQGANKIN